MEDLSVLFDDGAVAKYLIQVTVTPRKKAQSNIRGLFQVWRKSGWFGKADTLMNFCPAAGCMGTITNEFSLSVREVEELGEEDLMDPTAWPADIQDRYAGWWTLPCICPLCGTMGIRERLPDSYGFQMDAARIGRRMADLAHTLKLDTDIYLVRQPEAGAIQNARAHMLVATPDQQKLADSLGKARKREQAFYRMADIIRDTAAGADLAKRFQAFLEA